MPADAETTFDLDTAPTEDLERWKLIQEILKLDSEAKTAQYESELRRLEYERDRENRARFVAEDAQRIYHFDGAVCELEVATARMTLERWQRADEIAGVKRDITFVITSFGGSVFHGFALYDDLRAYGERNGVRVTTVVRGCAASMAGVLLQAGDERLIGAESRLHIHEPASLGVGKASEIGDEYQLLQSMFAQMCEIYARRSALSADEIRERTERHEWWLTAHEAVELGFADRIG